MCTDVRIALLLDDGDLESTVFVFRRNLGHGHFKIQGSFGGVLLIPIRPVWAGRISPVKNRISYLVRPNAPSPDMPQCRELLCPNPTHP